MQSSTKLAHDPSSAWYLQVVEQTQNSQSLDGIMYDIGHSSHTCSGHMALFAMACHEPFYHPPASLSFGHQGWCALKYL